MRAGTIRRLRREHRRRRTGHDSRRCQESRGCDSRGRCSDYRRVLDDLAVHMAPPRSRCAGRSPTRRSHAPPPTMPGSRTGCAGDRRAGTGFSCVRRRAPPDPTLWGESTSDGGLLCAEEKRYGVATADSCRARNCPTTTSPMSTPPTSAWPNSIRGGARQSQSSSMPIHAASLTARPSRGLRAGALCDPQAL